MTDAERTPDPAKAFRLLAPGTVVIFRHYEASDRAARGRRLAILARRLGLIFVVAGDRRLAHRLRADGLHLPDGMVRRRGRFAPQGDPWPVSAAAHDGPGLRRAVRAGVDLILLSPVFPTASHPGQPALGPRRLAALCRGSAVPILALGGVTPTTLRRVLAAGAAGVAGISALPHLCRDPFGLRAAHPRKARSRCLALGRDMV
ncbi:MAG TPA: thiamine phosphate synthase [Rhodospirillaceae bacterium]|nr:thiamine phosphate synthase [Rhodospirillaceae bacterium]